MTDQLKHFGVKGMRWGVRNRKAKKAQFIRDTISPDMKKAVGAFGKMKTTGMHSLSNEELRTLVTRLNLEKQYKSLQPTSKTKKAGKFVADMLLQAGKAEVSKLVVSQAMKQLPKLMVGLR